MKKNSVRIWAGVLVGGLAVCLLIGLFLHAKKPSYSLPAEPYERAESLEAYLATNAYEVGYFAKNVETGETVARYADRRVCLASMVKVFCLTELYRQKHQSGLDLDTKIEVDGHGTITLLEAADLMIGVSDNPSTYALAEFLGEEKVNGVPTQLGIDSMNMPILPDFQGLLDTLDERIQGERQAADGLPQHGTALGMARYYELLVTKEVFSPAISDDLLAFFARHPKPFTFHYADTYTFGGKGGNLVWTRPPKHYSMMGWSLYLMDQESEYTIVSVWGEWFPRNMPPDQQHEFMTFVSDSVVTIVTDAEQP